MKGKRNMKYKTFYQSELGPILLESDGSSLTVLAIKGQKHYQDKDDEKIMEKDDLEIFKKTKLWLDKYFQKEKMEKMDIPITYGGSLFQQLVWQELLKIPYGQVVTYKEIAQKVAQKMHKEKMSAQAVGGAVGSNPISILIPCHRVVGAKNNLTGYGGGIDKKQKLLEIEGIDIKMYHLPKK